MKIASTSAWSETGIEEYLSSSVMPIRLAVQDGEFPLVCSVWFLYDEARKSMLCASHDGSYLVKLIRKTPKCAFEIAPNEPPYHGVRGKADVLLHQDGVSELLDNLIRRYLGNSNDRLAKWLLSRVEQEWVLELKPRWLTAWDYSSRM
jgi:hypothetical protein